MSRTTLFDSEGHQNVLLPVFDPGEGVPANQHVIVHGGEAMLLDPGGHKVYSKVLAETMSVIGRGTLKYLLLSHQDPDIVAATNGWLMTTDAVALTPHIWTRFIPHFGVDKLVVSRLRGVPDGGEVVHLGGSPLLVLPAHFLHSAGNLHVFDPVSHILYSGDLFASLGHDYLSTSDVGSHIKYMQGFHQRYMPCNAAARLWVRMVRQLPVEIVAPQHGAYIVGADACAELFDWLEELPMGVDVMADLYRVPSV